MRKLGFILGLFIFALSVVSCEKDEFSDDVINTQTNDTLQVGDTVVTDFVDANGNSIEWIIGDGVRLRANQMGDLYFDPYSDSCYFETDYTYQSEVYDAKYEYIGEGEFVLTYDINDYSTLGQTKRTYNDTIKIISSYQDQGKINVLWKDFTPPLTNSKMYSYFLVD